MEFTLKQLSWIVIGSLGIGGTGYLNVIDKVTVLNTKVQVIQTQLDNQNKTLERMETLLNNLIKETKNGRTS